MGKLLRKRILSIFLVVSVLVTLQYPNKIVADTYISGSIIMHVDNQSVENGYNAYINHNFDCTLSWDGTDNIDDYNVKLFFDEKDEKHDITEYIVKKESNTIEVSISKNVVAGMSDEQHNIICDFYKDGELIYEGISDVIFRKSPEYIIYSGEVLQEYIANSNFSFEAGNTLWGRKFDWENPNGTYGYIDILRAEVINSDESPNAFALVENNGYYHLTAKEAGSAILKLYYDVPEGYVDNNNGCLSININSWQEMVKAYVSNLSTKKDKAVPGEIISLKGNVKEQNSEFEDGAVDTEHPICSYNWQIDDVYKDDIKLDVDKNDSSICNVIVLNQAMTDQWVSVKFEAEYLDMKGNMQKADAEYSFQIIKTNYVISCDLPDKINIGESVTFKPIVTKYDSEKSVDVTNSAQLDVSLQHSSDDSDDIAELVDNRNGTYTVMRKKAGFLYVIIRASDNGCFWDEETYSFQYPNSRIRFPDSVYIFDGNNPVRICLNIESLIDIDSDIVLYNNEQKIDKSLYKENRVDDYIYYTIEPRLFNNVIDNFMNISARVEKDGTSICDASTRIWIKKSYPQNIVETDLILNKSYNIFENGEFTYYSLIENVNTKCRYFIDSVSTNDDEYITIRKDSNKWRYIPIKEGNASITINYHYYKNKQKIIDYHTFYVNTKKSKTEYSINVERRKNDDCSYTISNLYPGNKYYYDVCGTVKEYIDGYENYNVYNDFVIGCQIMSNIEGLDVSIKYDTDNSFCLAIGENVPTDFVSKYIQIKVVAKDKDGNELANRIMTCYVTTATEYRGVINGFGSENEFTFNTSLYEYSYRYPYGKDVSEEYEVYYVPDENSGFVYKGKKSDGSFSFTRVKIKDENLVFEWKRKVDNSIVATGYTRFSTEPEIDDDKDNGIKKDYSLSVLDNGKLGLNVYFEGRTIYNGQIKVAFADSPDDSWYLPIEYVTSTNKSVYKSTIYVASGEVSRKIKIQLLSFNGDVIDEFITSVEEYIYKIINSTDDSYMKYKPMLTALLNYSAASQSYFGVRTDELANRMLPEDVRKCDEIPKAIINKYNRIKRVDRIKGLEYCGASLVLEDDIAIRLYFKLNQERDITNYSFMIGGRDHLVNTKAQKKGNMYYISLNNTNTETSFWDNKRLNITDGEGNFYGLTYSPLTYIARTYSTGKCNIKMTNLLKAMYWYEYQKQQFMNN